MVKVRTRALLVGLTLLTACELGSVTVPRGAPVVVVHGILSPQLRVQEIRVSRSLTGSGIQTEDSIPIPDPILDAQVAIIAPDGQVLAARVVDNAGTYAIFLDDYTNPDGTRVRIQPGKQYDLRVIVNSDTVRGHTTIPVTTRTLMGNVPFNRDVDSLRYDFSKVSFARGFWIRVESANEAYQLLTANRTVKIPGMVRNLNTADLSHTFYPGFVQPITAVAVDTNVYEYTRTSSDPFSGVGLVNSVTGGLGLFGSINEVDRRNLDVTQSPKADSIEGRFTLRSQNSSITELTLYLESPGVDEVPARVTGRYTTLNGEVAGIWATREKTGQIQMSFLNGFAAQGSRSMFSAVQHGDSIISTPSPLVVYVRAGK
jgi:hypothetical protein